VLLRSENLREPSSNFVRSLNTTRRRDRIYDIQDVLCCDLIDAVIAQSIDSHANLAIEFSESFWRRIALLAHHQIAVSNFLPRRPLPLLRRNGWPWSRCKFHDLRITAIQIQSER
jgi:hypothetical protein